MIEWLTTILGSLVFFVFLRVGYGVLIAPSEPKIRDWFFKTNIRAFGKVRLWMVRDVVTGKAHWQDTQNLFVACALVVLLPLWAAVAARSVFSEVVLKTVRIEAGVERVEKDKPQESPEQKLEKAESEVKRANWIYWITFPGLGLVVSTGFVWFGLRRMLTFEHERYLGRLQLLLSPEELQQLIRAENAIRLDAKTVYAYLGVVQELGETHGFGDLSQVWPKVFCQAPAITEKPSKPKKRATRE